EDLRVVEDLLGLADVTLDGDLVAAVEHRPGVHHDDRVDVDVDHPAGAQDAVGHLVHGALAGQAGADIEELADAGLGQVAYGPAQEGAVGPGGDSRLRHEGEDLLGRLAVRGAVGRAAEVGDGRALAVGVVAYDN